jgi:hypothetical protein
MIFQTSFKRRGQTENALCEEILHIRIPDASMAAEGCHGGHAEFERNVINARRP